MSVDASKYPALAKMEDCQAESQVVGDFLDWLGANGLAICESSPAFQGRSYFPLSTTPEELLARRFEIDLAAVERERRATLVDFTASRERGQ